MTANQIAYSKLKEEARHNAVYEYETERSNRAQEAERTRANTLNYQASIYATEASMYNAQLAAATSRYGYDTQAQVNREKIQTEHKDTVRQMSLNDTRKRQEIMLESEKQAETARHNREMEKVSKREATAKLIGTIAGSIKDISSSASNVLNIVSGIKGFATPPLFR